jgi:hypothetical protein
MDEVRVYPLLKSLRAIDVELPKQPVPADPNRQRLQACVQRLRDGADARAVSPGRD